MSTVCYFGTYEANYERNRILMAALEEAGVHVVVCHAPVWEQTRYKDGAVTSISRLGVLAGRMASGYLGLVWRYLRAPDHDVVMVGYLGYLDVFVARALTRLRGKKLVFDAFISLYDTLVVDRGLIAASSPAAGVLRWLDRTACNLADVVLLDTEAHIRYFVDAYGLPRGKFKRVLVGADTEQFHPWSREQLALSDVFTVLHFGKFAPLHGLPYILDAAYQLRDDPKIRFVLVGGGQKRGEVDERIAREGLHNVQRIEWVEPEELSRMIAAADVCLGIFGCTPKASRVIPNKVYEVMTVGAALITADTPGIRELLVDEEHALLCPAGDGAAIARAILRLRDDPALGERLAHNARRLFEERATPARIGEDLVQALVDLETLDPAVVASE